MPLPPCLRFFFLPLLMCGSVLRVFPAQENPPASRYAPRVHYGAPLEPAEGILHIAGQNSTLGFEQYMLQVGTGQAPTHYMTYVYLEPSPEILKKRLQTIGAHVAPYPKALGLQLGLSFADKPGNPNVAERILQGEFDASLEEVARGLQRIGRPVLVRIGYEANGVWNAYDPESYVAAFRYLTTFLRPRVDQLATVWCVVPTHDLKTIMTYDPGDRYADWWSLDLFGPEWLTKEETSSFLRLAHTRKKPVLIGESGPGKRSVHEGLDTWRDWYVPLFDLIRKHPGIKGFSYIHWNWPNTRWPDWGDARIHLHPAILERYRRELRDPAYRHLPWPETMRPHLLSPANERQTGVVPTLPNERIPREGSLFVHTPAQPDEEGSGVEFVFPLPAEIRHPRNILRAKFHVRGVIHHHHGSFVTLSMDAGNGYRVLTDQLGVRKWNPEMTEIRHWVRTDITTALQDAVAKGRDHIRIRVHRPNVTGVVGEFDSSTTPRGDPPMINLIYITEDPEKP